MLRRESKKGRKNDDQTKQSFQKKRYMKRDQQRTTFKNENKKGKCFKTREQNKEGKINKKKTNMQKQKMKKGNEQTSFLFLIWRIM